MNRTRSFDEVRAELADEHRMVMGLIARIEEPCPEEALPELLKSLHDLLVDHFAHEQFPGGLYERMGADMPEHHDTLRQLVREHCEILSAARGLVDRARAAEQASARDDGLRGEVDGVIARLREHETREHQLASALAAAPA